MAAVTIPDATTGEMRGAFLVSDPEMADALAQRLAATGAISCLTAA